MRLRFSQGFLGLGTSVRPDMMASLYASKSRLYWLSSAAVAYCAETDFFWNTNMVVLVTLGMLRWASSPGVKHHILSCDNGFVLFGVAASRQHTPFGL